MNLRIRLENFKGVFARVSFNIAMTSDRFSFASFEIDKNYSLTLPTRGKVCVTGGQVTSRNQGLSSNDQGRQRSESPGTRLHYLFLEAHSFPRATLSENCSLLGTYNVR